MSSFIRWCSWLLNQCISLIGTSTFLTWHTYTSTSRKIWKFTVIIPGNFILTPKLLVLVVFDYLCSYEVFSCNNFNLRPYHGTTRLLTATNFIYPPTPRHLCELHNPTGSKRRCPFPGGCIWHNYWRSHWRHLDWRYWNWLYSTSWCGPSAWRITNTSNHCRLCHYLGRHTWGGGRICSF